MENLIWEDAKGKKLILEVELLIFPDYMADSIVNYSMLDIEDRILLDLLRKVTIILLLNLN